MKLLTIPILLLLFAGCKNEGFQEPPNELTLQYQETVTKTIEDKDYTVSFRNIVENSLCPEDAVCVWLGRLLVQLDIDGVDYSLGFGDLTTNADGEYASEIYVGGFTVSIIKVTGNRESATTKVTLLFED